MHESKQFSCSHLSFVLSLSMAADTGKRVTLVVQTDQGKRVQDLFNPSLSLWAVLVELGLAECEVGHEPVLVYMRQQVCCENRYAYAKQSLPLQFFFLVKSTGRLIGLLLTGGWKESTPGHHAEEAGIGRRKWCYPPAWLPTATIIIVTH